MFSMPDSKPSQSKPLGSPLAELWGSHKVSEPFDVLIVGSGYGGAMAAAQLAGATVIDEKTGKARNLKVCLLERGEEYLPGEFPSHFGELPRHLRIGNQATGKVTGFHQGLFDLRLGPDVAALVANGLGGGSLINAGVMLAPRAEDFEEDSVFRGVIDDLHATNTFDLAKAKLGGTNSILNHSNWAGRPSLPKKTIALKKLAGMRDVDLPPITVSMRGGPNHAGVNLEACTLCGDCLTGCNVGAKDSLDANLLEIAHRGGVQIFTGATVLSLRRTNREELDAGYLDHWVLRVVHTDPSLQAREPEHLRVRAKKVILSAGTLGSTEILLRSRDEKIVFSSRLGERFSCNGDNIAAVHKMADEVNGRADPQTDVIAGARTVGPTITGSIPIPPDDPARPADKAAPASDRVNVKPRGFLVQEFSVPAALRQFFDELVTTRQMLENLPTKDNETHGAEGVEQIDPMAVDEAAMQRSLLIGVIGHDEADGVLHLSNQTHPRDRPPQQGALMIRWPQARYGHELNAAHKTLETLVAALKGTDPSQPSLVANPMWRLIHDDLAELVSQPRGPVLTVHALGGCAIGGGAHDGVVDQFGVVFDANRGHSKDHDWQGSLVVLDGSIIPGSLGVNPSLTISAVALRAMKNLMAPEHWDFAPGLLGRPVSNRRRLPLPAFHPPRATEVEIVERLRGPVRLNIGGPSPTPCIVDLTIRYKKAEMAKLSSRTIRELEVDPEHSRLRVFDQTDFDRMGLRFEPDSVLSRHALLEASLGGKLRFMHREPSGSLQRIGRTLWPWLSNRGARDMLKLVKDFFKPEQRDDSSGVLGWFNKARKAVFGILSAASRAGEVRRFEYVLNIEKILHSLETNGEPMLDFEPGDKILGVKRLTYGRRANPWRQLTELTITQMRQKAPGDSAVLKLDLSFLARERVPLVRIVGQQDHAKALADLASFGLYMIRVLLNNHLWTFRKPDEPGQAALREPQRLPGPISSLALTEITELKVGLMPDSDEPIVVRLTHYRKRPLSEQTRKADKVLPPLVMIHGYSASGTTFTHESLSKSAAEFFCVDDRDVWVIDLRSSAGMPTAANHWALEEPALVDIPAALLHIRQVSGQPVDVLAHCVGAAMLSMAILTQASDIKNNVVQLGADVWMTEEQLGTLAAFNGSTSTANQTHPCIRRIVLSQKGPLLHYSDANIFRSFILSKLRRLLLPSDFRFRPPPNPGAMSQLFDRILSSMPYSDDDFDVDNPKAFWKTTPWTAARHRMDLLYARTFEAANLDDKTLNAIDDLFGPMNVDTLAQIIQFARFNAITNQRGRGEFVTQEKLRDRWGRIPTLAIHGNLNGMVDVSTQSLMQEAMREAGVPFRAMPSDRPPYDRLGHQDILIGATSEAVFRDIEAFLNEDPFEVQPSNTGVPVSTPASCAPAHAFTVELPWIGPRIDLRSDDNRPRLQIAVMSSPDQGPAYLALVPAIKNTEKTSKGSVTRFKIGKGDWKLSSEGASSEWLTIDLPPHSHCCDQDRAQESEAGFIAVIVHESGAVAAVKPAPAGRLTTFFRPIQKGLLEEKASPEAPNLDDVKSAVCCWMKKQPVDLQEKTFLRCDDLCRAIMLHKTKEPRDLRFAFGSCQYPAGVFDQLIAQGSMRTLAASLDGANAPDLVLLLGDQIYADATGGMADATRIDERFEQPHVDALRMPPLREVMRRRSVRCLIDDHELSDNWEPLPADVVAKRPRDADRNRITLMAGREAFLRYQRMRPVTGCPAVRKAILSRPVDQEFDFAGHPFYLLDTRTGRSPRGSSTAPDSRLIIDEGQWAALCGWFEQYPEALKFVATPSVLLARRRRTVDNELACESSDAWDGFPLSVQRLIEFLYDKKITNTVFLSGDEHQSFHSEATVTRAGCAHELKIVSVHSSALYAPFPFANGRPTDFLASDNYSVGHCQLAVTTTLAPPGDGYAVIEVPADQQPPRHLNLRYLKAQGYDDGPGPAPISLPL
jgi:choline dehydrogenase-like flavoprotein/pimeloyl-ACP methyl ester carboxylesterase